MIYFDEQIEMESFPDSWKKDSPWATYHEYLVAKIRHRGEELPIPPVIYDRSIDDYRFATQADFDRLFERVRNEKKAL